MKRYVLALIVGFAAWLIACVLPVFVWADPLLLMRVSAVPMALACLVLAWLSPRVYPRRAARHITALLVGYFVVVLAVSVFATAAEIARAGIASTNVSGYLVWSWIYGAVFLPVSYPVSLGILCITRPK